MKLKSIQPENERKAKRTKRVNIGIIGIIVILGIMFAAFTLNGSAVSVSDSNQTVVGTSTHTLTQTLGEKIAHVSNFRMRMLTNDKRKAVAVRIAQERMKKKAAVTPAGGITGQAITGKAVTSQAAITTQAVLTPGGIPDYFGATPNYANSPLPMFVTVTTPPIPPTIIGNPLNARGVSTDTATQVLVVNPVDLSSGTLTGIQIYDQIGSGPNTFNAYVLRPTGIANQYTVVFDSGPLTVPSVATGQIQTFPVTPFQVQAGDRIAHYGNGIPFDSVGTVFDTVFYPANTVPGLGTPIDVASGTTGFPLCTVCGNRNYAIAASVIVDTTFGNPLGTRGVSSDSATNVLVVNTVPLSAGTLTSFQTYIQPGSGPNTFNAFVLRPAGAGQYTVVFDSGLLTVPSVTTGQIQTFPVTTPFTVQAGDLIAHYGNGIPFDSVGTVFDTVFYPANTAPTVSTSINVSSGDTTFPLCGTTCGNRNYAIAATVNVTSTSITSTALSGGIRKFVDSLPGLGTNPIGPGFGPNNLGKYIPLAVADNTTYNGSDYFEIGLVQYSEKMHSDLNNTTLRGYVQIETANNSGVSKHIPLYYPNGTAIMNATGGQVYAVDDPHYLGPIILAQKDRAVRIKFTNYLATGTDGNLFIPVDTTVMGAGPGPNATMTTDCSAVPTPPTCYNQNRATLHLHGGNTPWISDGTPHQWTTPAGEVTDYPKGVSVKNVPDMDGGSEPAGTLTFYYTNQQSARLMFYHDHAYGITRLNVYAGEAAGYLLRDDAEAALEANGTIPGLADNIPLVIQDKVFLPNAAQLAAQDPTWPIVYNASHSDLWYPHVYMPNQNPYDISGASPLGRWDYGVWFLPNPMTAASGLRHGTVPNPLFGTTLQEGPDNPGVPNISLVPEAFVDTPIVNGNAYPYANIGQKAYRLRILNAANDRYFNLQLYYASTAGPYVLFSGDGAGATATATVNATGSITGITLLDGGAGYTTANVSIFDAPGHIGATLATANTTIDPLTGMVTAINLLSNGNGYQVPALCNNATVPIASSLCTEVSMVPAAWPSAINFPSSWLVKSLSTNPPDIMNNRLGGIPDPRGIGPTMYQIGTEGGFLPAVAPIDNRPVGYINNLKDITVTNVGERALYLGPAERADVVVDFSGVPNGSTLILYNDAPAPMPAYDSRNDYFTGDVDQTLIGGAPTTIPGYGPNTRTIMQIRVDGSLGTAAAFNLTKLKAELPLAYAQYQDKPLVPQAVYNAAFNASYPVDVYARISARNLTFLPADSMPVRSITLTNRGSGYVVASPPAVTFSGGGGSGVNATTTVTNVVNSIAVLTNGSGYNTVPAVTITGGGGTGAAATATISGIVNTITITNRGTGYLVASPPAVTISGGGGSGATAVATVRNTGLLNTIVITNRGSGYTSAPTVTIAPPTAGTTATATATITNGVVKITVTNGGAGYTGVPTVTIAAPATGTRATARASITGVVSAITLTNGGSGYISVPTVTIDAPPIPLGNATATASARINVTMVLQPKAIQELFEFDYARMNAILGMELINANANTQTTIPYGYIDSPTEVINNSISGVALGTLSDGTQIWRITHNGVDTHAVHWHMFNLQVINRVGWDGAIHPIDPNEAGWKDTIRVNPLEDTIVALRPIIPVIPWDLPNSIRPLDVTSALGTTGQFGPTTGFAAVDPLNNPVTVTNHLVNYGWEYVWHCHLLGHEENDMMRPIIIAVNPQAPLNLTANLAGTLTNPRVVLNWTDNSTNEINWTVQRATSATGPWTNIAVLASATGPGTGTIQTYTNTPLARRTAYYYRVIANNVVGDTTVYASPAVGYPHVSADSLPSNTANQTTG